MTQRRKNLGNIHQEPKERFIFPSYVIKVFFFFFGKLNTLVTISKLILLRLELETPLLMSLPFKTLSVLLYEIDIIKYLLKKYM